MLAREVFSPRSLRWLLLAGVCGIGVWLATVTVRHWQTDAVSIATDGSVVSVQKFQTILHQEHLQLRISGDSLVIAPIKLVGPFRLGVVHSLTIQNGSIEVFPHNQVTSRDRMSTVTLDRLVSQLPSAFERFLTSAVLEQQPLAIARVTGGPFTVIQHHEDQEEVIFTATACRTDMRKTRAVCQNGTIHADGRTVAFRELSYDGRLWRLLPTSGDQRVVATWGELF